MIAAVVKVPGLPVMLGGEEYIMPPLALGPLKQLKPHLINFTANLDDESLETVIATAHSALTRNYPELTKEWVGSVVDVANMQEVIEACMDVSGLKRKQLEASGET